MLNMEGNYNFFSEEGRKSFFKSMYEEKDLP
jgi:hypothetical protein